MHIIHIILELISKLIIVHNYILQLIMDKIENI